MMPHIEVGASLVVYGENMAAYWDCEAHTVKLSITLFKEGDNER